MKIEAGDVGNTASHIAASHLHIKADAVTNTGYQFGTTTDKVDYKLPTQSLYSDRIGHYGYTFYRVAPSYTTFTEEGSLTSSITATNNLTMNVSNTVNNDTIKVASTPVGSQTQSVSQLNNDSAALSGPGNVSAAQLESVTLSKAPTITNQTQKTARQSSVTGPQSQAPDTVTLLDDAFLSEQSEVTLAKAHNVRTVSLDKRQGPQSQAVTKKDTSIVADATFDTSWQGDNAPSEISQAAMPTLDTPTYNEVTFPDYRLPTSPNGLFIYSDGPSSDYVIETNPLLTQKDQFLGSDYFLDSVNYHPEQDITFLGDAYYDTKVITQAIMAQTGQRYLSQDIGTDLAQMRALMDAAANEQQALSLEAGIALSAAQVAGLSQDILWYERVIINGQEVLAPKLYLANLDERNLHQGAVISGENVSITAGAIENSGRIAADNALTLVSEQGIVNRRGELLAGGDATLLANDDIINQSGQIAGDDVTLISQNGDIINETLNRQLNIDAIG